MKPVFIAVYVQGNAAMDNAEIEALRSEVQSEMKRASVCDCVGYCSAWT